jgi:hypothetical protein
VHSHPRIDQPPDDHRGGSRASHPHISEPTVGALRALRSPDRRMAFDRAVAARSCNPMYWGQNPGLSSSIEFARHSQWMRPAILLVPALPDSNV